MTGGLDRLTEREKETLRLLLAGHDAKSSARTLGLSVHTVNERLRDARRKLGVGSSREAARMLAAAEDPNRSGSGPELLGDKRFGVAGGAGGEASGRRRGRPLAWIAGGTAMISIAVAALMLAPSSDRAPAPAPAAVTDERRSVSAAAARRWVALVDAGRWADSWQAAGEGFRSEVTADGWAAMVRPVREPLGAVAERRFQSSTRATTLPGAPEGDYEVVQFATRFADRPQAVETVVMVREGAGWGVTGYFIR